jgi:hypothetical protein
MAGLVPAIPTGTGAALDRRDKPGDDERHRAGTTSTMTNAWRAVFPVMPNLL